MQTMVSILVALVEHAIKADTADWIVIVWNSCAKWLLMISGWNS
jgi:hypothetical protein